MGVVEPFDTLELDDDLVFDKEVGPKALFEFETLVLDRDRNLNGNYSPPLTQLPMTQLPTPRPLWRPWAALHTAIRGNPIGPLAKPQSAQRESTFLARFAAWREYWAGIGHAVHVMRNATGNE